MNPRNPGPPLPLSPAHIALDRVRRKLLLAVDELRTLLINGDDLHRLADTALQESLAGITKLAEAYQAARGRADAQPGDLTAGLPRRRYINPGDTILVVLPDTEHCRRAHLAGRRTRVHVTAVDAERPHRWPRTAAPAARRRRNPPRPGHRPALHPHARRRTAMIRPPCPTCGQRFGQEDGCTAGTHLHQGSQWPGNPYFRHLCTTTWQTSAVNAKDAFTIWLYEVELGNITDPVRARHLGIARRFRNALHAASVYWLEPPGIEFNIMLPGSWQIWIEIVPGYRCRWDQRQPPTGFDGDAMRTALRQLESVARRVKDARCPCQYRLRTIAGAEHPQHCGCFCHQIP